jgi:hypothetical protein
MISQNKGVVSTSVRVSEICDALWEATAEHLGLSKSATLEFALRKLARAEGVNLPSRATTHVANEETENIERL